MASDRAPETSVLRLSRYHCFLGELMGVRTSRRVTSRELAEELGLSEETVRHDLAYVDVAGRPGAGYDIHELYEAVQDYLELSDSYPFAVVGNADSLRGLTVTFPAEQFGMRPLAYFSEQPADVGLTVAGIGILALDDAPTVLPELGVTVALVACEPAAVDGVLASLGKAGICGVVMLTPVMRPIHPEGMNVTYFRMPCALKSLAAVRPVAEQPGSCCGAGE